MSTGTSPRAAAPDVGDPPSLHAFRFSPWKQPIVRRFFPRSTVTFVRDSLSVPDGAVLVTWGTGPLPEPLEHRIGRAVTRWHIEDGFLRSVGLGADLVRPLSWVVDRSGLYFDATRPSDFETMLQSASFDAAVLERAAVLRQRLVSNALTKYNLIGCSWRRPNHRRPVILVPGQVEADASIRFGSPVVRHNRELLELVRAARPEAHIVYKPHPDVTAGLRARGNGESLAERWCDEIVTEIGMGELLDQVDEVHTMTSLTGFEALLRGVPVTCWGQPFYAGWGLTDDRHPPPRRSRRATLDELVAAALILYPRYVRRADGRPGTAEQAVDDLLAWRKCSAPGPRWWQRLARPALGWGRA
jgi:capsular polysaccharide export protein